MVNAVKQASDFGLDKTSQKLTAPLAFCWDMNDEMIAIAAAVGDLDLGQRVLVPERLQSPNT